MPQVQILSPRYPIPVSGWIPGLQSLIWPLPTLGFSGQRLVHDNLPAIALASDPMVGMLSG